MEQCHAAERALVASLVLGQADPAELSGRLRPSDFTDPAASVLFEVALSARGSDGVGWGAELPRILRRQGLLRRDGYPISQLLEWMPRLPVPVHPEAWATLVVAGSLARQVHASGVRILQSVDTVRELGRGPGRVLAMAEAQHAAVVSATRRWQGLPQRWRETVHVTPATVPAGTRAGGGADAGSAGRELRLLAGLVAAPQLLGRLSWLRAEDFTDPACRSLFGTLRRLNEYGRPIDVVTLAAAAEAAPVGPDAEAPAALASSLRPEQTFPTEVPFLARQLLTDAVIEQARGVGEDLVQLATAPAVAGGLGAPMLAAARTRLLSLRPHALRLENAGRNARPCAGEPSRLSRSPALPAADRAQTLDRQPG